MTKPNDMITITKDDIEISLPISALQYYDKVVDLAHLVILGEAVPELTVGAGVVDKLKEAMASDNPIEALQKIRDGVQPGPPARKDLKAEVIEKGETPKDDPMVRIAEVAMRCAESVGMPFSPNTPAVRIIPVIASMVKEAQGQLDKIAQIGQVAMGAINAKPSEDPGFVGTFKNIQSIAAILKREAESNVGGWKAVKVLRDTLGSLGIKVKERDQGSLEQCIGDCQEALSLAARRGHYLSNKQEAKP